MSTRRLLQVVVQGRRYSVTMTKKGRYTVQAYFGVNADGSKKYFKKTCDTLEELQEMCDKEFKDWFIMRAAEDNAKETVTEIITADRLIYDYADTVKAQKATDRSRRQAAKALKAKTALCEKDVHELTKPDYYSAVADLVDCGYARKSITNYLTELFAAANFYEITIPDKLKRDLKKYINRTAADGRNASKPWADLPHADVIAEWAARNSEPHSSEMLVVTLLGLHSMRLGEILGLNYANVVKADNGDCYINVCDTMTLDGLRKNRCKTEASRRQIPIDSRLYELIQSRYHTDPCDRVVNLKRSAVSLHFKKLMIAHNADWITPHILRHVYRSDNKDNECARAAGGWTSTGGADVKYYAHARPDEVRAAILPYSEKIMNVVEWASRFKKGGE